MTGHKGWALEMNERMVHIECILCKKPKEFISYCLAPEDIQNEIDNVVHARY